MKKLLILLSIATTALLAACADSELEFTKSVTNSVEQIIGEKIHTIESWTFKGHEGEHIYCGKVNNSTRFFAKEGQEILINEAAAEEYKRSCGRYDKEYLVASCVEKHVNRCKLSCITNPVESYCTFMNIGNTSSIIGSGCKSKLEGLTTSEQRDKCSTDACDRVASAVRYDCIAEVDAKNRR